MIHFVPNAFLIFFIRMKKLNHALMGGFLFLSFNLFATELPKFFKVNDGIYRSARPEEGDLKWAKENYGIKTIINLENNKEVIANEARVANDLEMNHVSNPMAWYTDVTDKQIGEIMDLMNDPKNYPILVHCHEGKDRTGLVVGLYRVLIEKWEPESAYKEMLEKNFNPMLWKFRNYFAKRTGYEPYQKIND